MHLIENPSLTNNLFYGIITLGNFTEEQLYKLWNYMKAVRYINVVPLYIEDLNDKYLYYKKKVTLFILMNSAKYVFRLMGVGKKQVIKIKKNRNLDTSDNINSFLDKLEKTKSNTAKKMELDNLIEKLVKKE